MAETIAEDTSWGLVRSALNTALLRPNTVVLFGDSITAQNTSAAAPNSKTMDYGFFTWAQALSGHRLELLYNAGIGGNTTAQMLARVDADVLGYRPGYVTLMGGTNDPDGDAAGTIANLRAIYDKFRAAGIYVFALSILPRPTGTTQKKQDIVRVNRWIADFWRRTPGGEFVDAYDSIILRAGSAQNVTTSTLHDNVHPSNLGAFLIGKILAAAIRARVPESKKLISSVYDYRSNNAPSDVVVENGLFFNATGGIIDSPLTGSAPAGWRVSGVSGGGGVVSVEAAPDGVGNALRIQATGAADNDGIIAKYNPNLIGAGLAVGDLYYFEAMIRVANPVQLKRIYSRSTVTGGGGNMVWADSGATMFPFPEGFDILMRSPIAQVPVGTIGLGWNALEAYFKAAGGASDIWISRAALRKWTDPNA